MKGNGKGVAFTATYRQKHMLFAQFYILSSLLPLHPMHISVRHSIPGRSSHHGNCILSYCHAISYANEKGESDGDGLNHV